LSNGEKRKQRRLNFQSKSRKFLEGFNRKQQKNAQQKSDSSLLGNGKIKASDNLSEGDRVGYADRLYQVQSFGNKESNLKDKVKRSKRKKQQIADDFAQKQDTTESREFQSKEAFISENRFMKENSFIFMEDENGNSKNCFNDDFTDIHQQKNTYCRSDKKIKYKHRYSKTEHEQSYGNTYNKVNILKDFDGEQQQTFDDFTQSQDTMENKGFQSKESSSYEDNFTQENDFLFEAGKKNNYDNCPGNGFTSTQQQKNTYHKMRKKSGYRHEEFRKRQNQDDRNTYDKSDMNFVNQDEAYEKTSGNDTKRKNSTNSERNTTGQDADHFTFTDYTTFTEDEEASFTRNRKLNKLQKKSEKAEKRLDKAKKKLPKQKGYHWNRVFNEDTGKGKYVLKAVEKERRTKKLSLSKRMVKKLQQEGGNFIHGKVAEYEKENSGVEAVHKTEQTAEHVFDFITEHTESKKQRQREKAAKLEKKKFKTDIDFLYQKYLEENPEIRKKILQKRMQKKRIKRKYAKAYHKGQIAKNAEEAVIRTENSATAAAGKLKKIVGRNAVFIGASGIMLFLLLIIMTGVSFCGVMFGDMISIAVTGSYLSKPEEIDKAELCFMKKEMELQKKIDQIKIDYPGYDEYHYDLGVIQHDPFALISYLSAVYTEFIADETDSELDALFQEMYTLTLTPTMETRTRTESEIMIDPVTGIVSTGTKEVEYEVSILQVALNVESLENIVESKMDTEQMELFASCMETKGALQQFASPLDLYWYNYISSYYGYRKNPITRDWQFHRGIDLAVPEGASVYATHDGTVTSATYNSGYGNYIIITDEKGISTKYAHLSSIYVSEGQDITEGMQIGTAGSTGNSTGSHLHLEVSENGTYYNPLFYFDVGKNSDPAD